MREVYLDNAATTPCDVKVAEMMVSVMTQNYGNPSALHQKGLESEKVIKECRGTIGSLLKVAPERIVFTSGGTESNNLGILGYVFANQRSGRHLITTEGEHSSVKNVFEFLEKEGFEVTYISLNQNGQVNLDNLEKSLRPDTILVSMMLVNNEVGSVNPVWDVKEMIKKSGCKAALHVDAVQGLGKLMIYPTKWGIDILSGSGHKFYGPKGTGLLYLSPNIKWKSYIFGGGQQGGRRSGTENVPGILGMTKALEIAYKEMDKRLEHIKKLREYLELGLADISEVTVLSDGDTVPHICHIGIDGLRGEVLLHALEAFGIYVSTGSACSSHSKAVSNTLESMGIKKEYLGHSLRISLGYQNTIEEIEYFLGHLKEQIQMLSLFIRK